MSPAVVARCRSQVLPDGLGDLIFGENALGAQAFVGNVAQVVSDRKSKSRDGILSNMWTEILNVR